MRFTTIQSGLIAILYLLCIQSSYGQSRYLGAAINDPYTMGYGGIERTNVGCKPLLNDLLDSQEVFWANQVEQYETAGLDFVAPWLKGRSPVDGKPRNTPERLSLLVKAIEDRGLTGKVTIMPYDDNPASWTAAWNFAAGRGYGYAKPFPVDDQTLWAYVWDYNFKVFFDTVPYKHLFKIKGHPVFSIWSCSGTFVSGMKGNGSKLISYIKDQCEKRYGWRPHFRASSEWISADPSSDDPRIVDSTAAWFEPKPRPHPYSHSVSRYRGIINAVLIPSFAVNQEFWEPDHGNTLANNLMTARTSDVADITLVEGFDNYFEGCALWRVRSLNADGTPISYERSGYDYPNQRINILRKYSNHPFPEVLKLEAEWCDEFGGYPAMPNQHRNGPIHISASNDPLDPLHGYVVDDIRPGQWLRWRDVPMQNNVNLRLRYATSKEGSRLRFKIDGTEHPSIELPHSGGLNKYRDYVATGYTFPGNSYHTVTIIFETGEMTLNRWNVEAAK